MILATYNPVFTSDDIFDMGVAVMELGDLPAPPIENPEWPTEEEQWEGVAGK